MSDAWMRAPTWCDQPVYGRRTVRYELRMRRPCAGTGSCGRIARRSSRYAAGESVIENVLGPAAARRARARRRAPSSASTRSSAAASATGSPGATSKASTPSVGHVAVAGERAGDDRCAGRHRLDQHDAERLAVRATARRTRRTRAAGRSSRPR